VRAVLQVALGILAAVGGFVDIGELVFNGQAGARFGYSLLWAILLGLVGILIFAEMCGRIAAVSRRAVFDAIRERMGFAVGLVALLSAELVCLMTLTAELGGVAIVLRLLTNLPYALLLPLSTAGLIALFVLAPFDWLERLFGYGGLCLLVFAVAAAALHVDWGRAAMGVVPTIDTHQPLLYGYFAVGLIATTVSPYEVYFYSSGGVEDRWTPKDLGINRVTVFVGFGLGALLSAAILAVSAEVLQPHSIVPQHLGGTALGLAALGPAALLIGLLGMLFAIGGATLETSFAGAYSLCQFLGWPWGKYLGASRAVRFTVAWIAAMVLAGLVLVTGVDPVTVTEYAVIFAAVAMPLTYAPLLLVANDPSYLGAHVNGRFANAAGVFFLVVILVAAVLAIPLLVLTGAGGG
jgi:Mn2+/Fe2+ NRAMP family transporter